jgi:hypothetical protein
MPSSLLLTSNKKVKVSSTNFDDIILKYKPKANINFTIIDSGIKMDIDFEVSQNKEKSTGIYNKVVLSVKFYLDDNETDIKHIDREDIVVLVKAYQQLINTMVEKTKKHSLFSKQRLQEFLLSLVKLNIVLKINEVKGVLSRYQYLRAIDVVSLYRINLKEDSKPIAKTIIELDADIITILPNDFQKLENEADIHSLLSIHRLNLGLANYIFLYPILRISKIIKHATGIARKGSLILSLVAGFGLYQSTGFDPNYVPYSALYLVGAPAMVYQFVPKIMGFIIKNKLFGQSKIERKGN